MTSESSGEEKQLIHLLVVSGPDKGKMFFLQAKHEALIGRGPTADLRLTDPGSSQKHCVVRSVGDMVFVEDLGSRNGTAVNGERITSRVMDEGGKIQVGTSMIDLTFVATERDVPLASVESDFAPTLLERQNTAQMIRLDGDSGSTIVGAGQLTEFRAAQKLLGSTISGYLLLEVIGAGGLGFVFRAKNMKSKQEVALKLIRKSDVKSPERLEKFLRECQTELKIPNAVQLQATGEDDNFGFIAMEMVRGRNVQSAIENGSKFSLHEALGIIAAIGETLHAAHQAGIIHRDVRPANIVLPDIGSPVLLDLGMGKKTDREGIPVVAKNDRLENLSYISPELTREAATDARTDVYATAATLFFILSAKKLFQADTHLELVRKIRWDSPPLVTDFRKDVPPAFAAALARATEKEPERRYPDMPQFTKALQQSIKP